MTPPTAPPAALQFFTTGINKQPTRQNCWPPSRAPPWEASCTRWASLGPGAGTLRYIRGTNKIEFKHRVTLNGVVVYSDDLEAQLEASATYRGRIYRATTPRISLIPHEKQSYL